MEYIDGKSVAQLIQGCGMLPPAAAAEVTRQVALGLEYLDRKGLFHRDVTPSNILVDRGGTAKLTDFGLAVHLDEPDILTVEGSTLGTFDYLSPEQARAPHGIDIRSDIYSLGCSCYHMIAGVVPFPGDHDGREADGPPGARGRSPRDAGAVLPSRARRGRPPDDEEVGPPRGTPGPPRSPRPSNPSPPGRAR